MAAQNPKRNQSEPYQFIKGAIPVGFKLEYEPSLYNTLEHRALQSSSDWHSYHIIRKDKEKVISSISFCVKKEVAYSPLSAPYGFFEIADAASASILYDFILYCEADLLRHSVKRILIKGYPEGRNVKMHNMLTVLLFNHQYKVSNAELGALLRIDETSFEDKIDQWERRKLKQALKAKLSFKSISIKKLNEVYQFIQTCREERGHQLSMSLDELFLTAKKLKDSFFCFGAYHNGKLIAASISIRESKSIQYNFYSAHSRESDGLSPMVFLVSQLYKDCKKNKIRLLDLGTSALGGKPNFSLIDFKLRLGAAPSMKLTFEKVLK